MKKILFIALAMFVFAINNTSSHAAGVPPCDPLTEYEVWNCGPCGECGCPELVCVPKERYGCDPAEQAKLAGTEMDGKMTSICDGSAYNNNPLPAPVNGIASPNADQQAQIDRALGDAITTFENTVADSKNYTPTVNVDAVSIITNVEATRGDVSMAPPGTSNFINQPSLGSPGDTCPTNALYFVQTNTTICGCDNPLTAAVNECVRGVPGQECLPNYPGLYLQNDAMTCACNNPLTDGDECGPPLGNPGDACPLVPGEFILADGYDCGCDSPTTPYDECPGPLGNAGDVCPSNPALFVSSNTYTCDCDNPTTAATNECFIGNPGDVCPTNPAQFVQNNQLTCGCDNPTTAINECVPPNNPACVAACDAMFPGFPIACISSCNANPCTSPVASSFPACGGGGGGGCFGANTNILLEDGTTKKIVDMKIGDRVMSFDKKDGAESTLSGSRVTHIFLMDEKAVYDVAGTRVTATHVFMTGDGRMVALKDMKPDDTIALADGTMFPLGKVEMVGFEKVYNFTVENTHTYVANDMRSSNMTIVSPPLPEGVYTEKDLHQVGAVNAKN